MRSLMSDVWNGETWRTAWRVLLAVALVSISWLAFTPNPPPAADLGWDKANHFTAFGTLAFLGLQSLRVGAARTWRGAVLVLAGLLAYGIFIELVQSQIPGRDADAEDVVADMIGAVAGLVVHAVAARVLGHLLRPLSPSIPR